MHRWNSDEDKFMTIKPELREHNGHIPEKFLWLKFYGDIPRMTD